MLTVAGFPAAAQDAPETPPDTPSTEIEAILLQSEMVLATVERMRGIRATEPVERAVQSRSELRALLEEIIEEEYGVDMVEDDERLLHALRILEPDQSYLELTLDLLEDQIAGFYDDREQVFYLMDDGQPAEQAPIMAHELFHAIQDQEWGINTIRGRTDLMTDAALARTALIEGDALAVMVDFIIGESNPLLEFPMADQIVSNAAPADSGMEEMPDFMWDQLVYPYIGGLGFVIAVLQAGQSWEAVNAIYRDPPTSTEQVVHPERYINRDHPTFLLYDDGVEAERYYTDVFGEFTLLSVFRQLLDGLVSERAIDSAMSGWDGDRLHAYRFADDSDRDLLVHLSVWDSVEDAEQFVSVAGRLGAAWLPSQEYTEASGAHGESVTWSDETGYFAAHRWGDLVVWIADLGGSVEADTRRAEAELAIDSVWTTVERYAYPSLEAQD